MENEYNSEVIMTPMGKKTVRWIKPEDLDERMSSSRNILAKDRFDQPFSFSKMILLFVGSQINTQKLN